MNFFVLFQIPCICSFSSEEPAFTWEVAPVFVPWQNILGEPRRKKRNWKAYWCDRKEVQNSSYLYKCTWSQSIAYEWMKQSCFHLKESILKIFYGAETGSKIDLIHSIIFSPNCKSLLLNKVRRIRNLTWFKSSMLMSAAAQHSIVSSMSPVKWTKW